MLSEKNSKQRVQVRIGHITLSSYLFFPSTIGDLILKPGDEIILVARSGQSGQPKYRGALRKTSIFDKVREKMASKAVLARMTNKEIDDDDYSFILEQVKAALNSMQV